MISIVTPTYNSEEYLERCILSIKDQDFYDYEHIIVDGGSTDRTLDIIKSYERKYPMRWISEKDDGMYDAIAKGFRIAKGDIFCWLNSDDIYMPWTLKTVNKVFFNESINWCCGMPAQINEYDIPYFKVTRAVTFPQYCIKKGWMDGQRLGCVQQESSFWRKELYEKAGGIDTKYKLAGDYALWVKFARYEKLYSVNTILAGFRIHPGQKSSNRTAYCNEAHKLGAVEKVMNKIKVYRIINYILKKQERLININKF